MLSVIIPTLNSASTISLTLSSIFSESFPRELLEVIVVDNGSTDNTLEIAKKYNVKTLVCKKRGIGPPRNLGIKEAKGDILCFTDSDCVVTNDWLVKIHDFFKANLDVDGIGGPTLPYPHAQNRVQQLTGEIFVDEQWYPTTIKKVKFGASGPLLFGTNSAHRKEILVSAGGFPEPGGSSLELSWKLTANKRTLLFVPWMQVFHIFPSDIYSIFKQHFRWGSQSASMQKRYLGNWEALKRIAFSSYFLIKHVLSLAFSKNFSKKMLQISQNTVYLIGKIYGLKSSSVHHKKVFQSTLSSE